MRPAMGGGEDGVEAEQISDYAILIRVVREEGLLVVDAGMVLLTAKREYVGEIVVGVPLSAGASECGERRIVAAEEGESEAEVGDRGGVSTDDRRASRRGALTRAR